jgi:hypothetical protein
MDEFVPIASSAERPSLERLEKYLRHHGIGCRMDQGDQGGRAVGKFTLLVPPAELDKAMQVLDGIAYGSSDPDKAEEVVEVSFDGTERLEVATWLQILLDEEDNEGSPIFFFRAEYEAMLDELHGTGHVEIPVYILLGLQNFIPEGPKRALMGSGLQEFFSLIEAVAEDEDED